MKMDKKTRIKEWVFLQKRAPFFILLLKIYTALPLKKIASPFDRAG
jgi:hypothetical protein